MLQGQINSPQTLQTPVIPSSRERPWDLISMDFIKWFPLSEGYNMILVVIDQLTKMGLFIPTYSGIDASELNMIFLRHVFAKHGTPSDIILDRGKHFTLNFGPHCAKSLGLKATYQPLTTPKLIFKPSKSIKSLSNTFTSSLTINKMTRSTFCHLLNLHTITQHSQPHRSLLFSWIKGSIQNSKCHSLWLLWTMLTAIVQTWKHCMNTFAIK